MWYAWQRGAKCTWFYGKARRKEQLKRPSRRGEDGIRMDLREIGWSGGRDEWIQLAQNRDRWRALVNTVMNLLVLAPRSWLECAVTYPKH
jgi:hypothetical protein